MFGIFKKSPKKRSLYFHEDDYCQQQILPQTSIDKATGELSAIQDFSSAHQAPSGIGWTDVYIRSDDYDGISVIALHRDILDSRISPILTRFDDVYTGYSSHKEICRRTWAWGVSDRCAILADWNDDLIIQNIWTEFFDSSETAIEGATQAVAAISPSDTLFYIDWAWDYTCPASYSTLFRARLVSKLADIDNNRKQLQQKG
jgi:hypothetical protein